MCHIQIKINKKWYWNSNSESYFPNSNSNSEAYILEVPTTNAFAFIIIINKAFTISILSDIGLY